ncbi:MAG: non-canonical purine NTP pyrophosphatase, partial [Caulobacterales bacterium]|nr:non-canonical purine NTP pyrophosphatase [Caulobacterales bacterium]
MDALDGRPGIFSSRFAGQGASDRQNIDKLLSEMGELSADQRSAHFYCAMAMVRHAGDPEPLLASGRWD